MEAFVVHIFGFILPLLFGNISHLVVIKNDLFSPYAKPISSKLFGAGKTYRGFIVMPIFTGVFGLVFGNIDAPEHIFGSHFMLGFILGLTYCLGELPNSFIKRKLGIASGASVQKNRWLQILADKLDSLSLLGVVYFFTVDIELVHVFALIGSSFGLHLIFSFLFYKLKLKKAF